MSDKKRILLVEDSRSVRQQVRVVLNDAGYEVIETEDGVEGLAAIQRLKDIDLVIADINMPKKNGLEMLEEAKPQVEAGLTVIMLTTEGRPAFIKRAKAAGARGWIVKPFKPAQLIATVERLTRLYKI